MFIKRFFILFLIFLTQLSVAQKIVGYFPYYRSVAQASAVQYDKLTDVIYAFATLNSDGTLVIRGPGGNGDLSVFNEVKSKCAANQVKFRLAIGGWGLSGAFSGVAANSTYRTNLANACLSLCQTHGLDGMDIDWEFPLAGDKANYVLMLQEIKAKLGTTYTLSAALGGEAAHTVGIDAQAFQHLDYFYIMSYDAPIATYGNHTAVQFGKDAMELYNSLGCPYDKMFIGSGFYSRCAGERTYADVSSSDPAGYYNDPDGILNGYCYDSRVTLEEKIDYAVGTKGGAGIMIWELSQDRNDQYSLLSAVYTKMQEYACPIPDPDISGGSLCGSGSFTLKAYSGTQPSGVTYSWKRNGSGITGSGNSLSVSQAGTYEVTVSTGSCDKKKSVVISATLPVIDLGTTQDLCSPTTTTLDAGVSGNGLNYVWKNNGTVISGANTQTLFVNKAGTYEVTVSASGCSSQSGSVVITSSLVDVQDQTRCGSGSVTFTVNNPEAGATYDWYPVATGGTKIVSGNSYSPNLISTTTYYVEKVATGVNCVGVEVYDPLKNYSGGSVVNYNGEKWTAAYWANPGENPGKIGGQWNSNGSCGGPSCDRTMVVGTVDNCGTVNPTITFNNVNKTYGDASFAMTATSNSSGALTYSIQSGTAASITSNGQVIILGAGVVTVKVDQAAASGYNAGSQTATLTIAKKDLTITADNKSRAYNTANPTLTMTYTGFAYSDNAGAITSPTIATTAVTSSNAGTYAISLTGGSAANYNLLLNNGTLTVNKIDPTLTYTGLTSGTVSTSIALSATSNSSGVISYTVTNGTGAATVNGANLDLTSVGTVTLNITVAATTNYNAKTINQVITINSVATQNPTITFNNVNKTYGDASFAMTATSNSSGTLTYSIQSGTAASITSNGQVTILGAGTVTVKVDQAAASGYNAGSQTATLTIAKKDLTITADDKSRAYNTANPTLTMTYTGFAYSDNAGAITSPTIATTAITSSNAGTYTITLSGGSAANYNLLLNNGTLTVNKIDPTLTYTGLTSGTVSTSLALSATSNSSGLISYTVTNGTGAATVNGSNLDLTSAGSVTLNITVAATTNYNAKTINQVITINSVATQNPTITFNNVNKTYGDASFTMTATSNSTGALTYSIQSGTAASITANGQVTILGAGVVTVKVDQAAASGYNAGSQTATLTIAKKDLTITADNKSRAYNTANPTLTMTYTGFAYSDNAGAITSPTIATTAVTSSNAGTYAITLTGGSAANYNLLLNNGTLTVNKIDPTLTYTGLTSGTVSTSLALSATSNSIGGISYTVTNGTGAATVNGSNLDLTSVGTVTLNITVAATTNYNAKTINQVITINSVVTQNPTITFNNVNKTYGDASFAMTATSNSSGALTYSIQSGTAASITSNGQVTILGAGVVTVKVDQAAASGYNAGSQTATLTIAKKDLTITADNKSRAYNTANPTLTMTYTGFAYSDNAGAITSPTIATTAVTSSNAGTYAITLSGGSAANYNLLLNNGTLTVNKIDPTLTYTGLTSGTVSTSLALSATSNSTGLISYTVTNGSGAATVNGSNLDLTSAGTVTLNITVAASTNYNAKTINQVITINAGVQQTATPVFTETSDRVCMGSSAIVYSVESQPNTSYSWIINNGATIVTGQGTNAIFVSFENKKQQVIISCYATENGKTISNGAIQIVDVVDCSVTSTTLSSNLLTQSVYPNPSTSTFNIEVDTPVEMTVMNMFGQIIEERTIDSSIEIGGNYTAGTYVVKIQKDNQIQILKIIKE